MQQVRDMKEVVVVVQDMTNEKEEETMKKIKVQNKNKKKEIQEAKNIIIPKFNAIVVRNIVIMLTNAINLRKILTMWYLDSRATIFLLTYKEDMQEMWYLDTRATKQICHYKNIFIYDEWISLLWRLFKNIDERQR